MQNTTIPNTNFTNDQSLDPANSISPNQISNSQYNSAGSWQPIIIKPANSTSDNSLANNDQRPPNKSNGMLPIYIGLGMIIFGLGQFFSLDSQRSMADGLTAAICITVFIPLGIAILLFGFIRWLVHRSAQTLPESNKKDK